MKSKFKSASWFAAMVAAIAMAGCAATRDAEHRQHHPDASAAQTAGTMSPGGPGGPMMMMDMKDMKAMCEMHKNMMGTRTPAEQKAMMDERMKSMSPEMMKRHQAMMAECR